MRQFDLTDRSEHESANTFWVESRLPNNIFNFLGHVDRARFWLLFSVSLMLTIETGCSGKKQPLNDKGAAGAILVGSAIVGEGGDSAAINVVLGSKSGPVGTAFSLGLTNQDQGHPASILLLEPNVPVKPSTLLVSRVTLANVKGFVQFFGPVQQGISKAIVDSIADKLIPEEKAEELVMIVAAFCHPDAGDDAKLFQNNYDATKAALKQAMAGGPTVQEIEKIRRKKPQK